MISADPGLSQGRGGAWDHRRCGTLCPATSSPFGSVHENSPNPSPGLLAASTSQSSHSILPSRAFRGAYARLQKSPKLSKPCAKPFGSATSQSSHGILLFRAFRGAVCQASNVPNAPLELFCPLPAAALSF